MECKIFYSWQSDLSNATNYDFIQTELENAAKSIRDDESIKIEPVIDRDTVGVPGAPDIAGTIFAKIEKSQIFVADVSIINKGDKLRKAPNPNVLVELGYAMKTLGLERIIMVMNAAYGDPELLPFDLRMRRVVTYRMSESQKDESTERKKLSSALEQGIRTILEGIEQQRTQSFAPLPLLEQAITGITNSQQNRGFLVQEYMKSLRNALLEIARSFPGNDETDEPDEVLLQSIEKSTDHIVDFARLSETIAVVDSEEAAMALYKSFSFILDRYNYTPPNFSGSYQITHYDFFKFIGHEMFTIFTSFQIRENNWELLTNIFDEGIFVSRSHTGNPDSVSFDYISKGVQLFSYRKQRLGSNRMSIYADLLNDRHSTGTLGDICPIEQFISADFFLFVREPNWNPRSTLYLSKHSNFPKFLVEAKREKFARELFTPLKVEDINTLRTKLANASAQLHNFYRSGFWDSCLDDFDFKSIGSKQ